jgi:hypothetical protein
MSTLNTGTRSNRVRGLALAGLLGGGATFAVPATAAESHWCAPGCGTIVADWGLTAYAVFRAQDGYADPLAAARTLAMMHIAMHDAVNAARPRFAGYALDATARAPDADAAVAAVVAAHDVLLALHPEQAGILAAALDRALLDAGVGAAVEAGQAVGAAAAEAIVAARADDGADGAEAYIEGDAPGLYRFVPGTDFIFAPHWRRMQPFALDTPDQFRTDPPPALDGTAYAEALAEVKTAGSVASGTRSEDETAYAAFWYEFSDIGWNRVTRVAAREAELDLWDGARLFALVNMALSDGYVAGWDSKLAHDFWRPVTAIRLAGEDGNPATEPDPYWESFLPTPPIQDHPSTHATLGAAAATVLETVLGESFAFTMTSSSALPEAPVRSFASFAAAAEENAESRIHAGLHFRFATDAGLEFGRKIGGHVAAELLAPLY